VAAVTPIAAQRSAGQIAGSRHGPTPSLPIRSGAALVRDIAPQGGAERGLPRGRVAGSAQKGAEVTQRAAGAAQQAAPGTGTQEVQRAAQQGTIGPAKVTATQLGDTGIGLLFLAVAFGVVSALTGLSSGGRRAARAGAGSRRIR
jgi:hypothetical protein